MFTTRKLPIPKQPLITQKATADELVAQLNVRWDALESLNVTVEMQASVLKSKEGLARDYTSFRGHILMRKPGMMRVLGQVPVLGTRMFDMASDGKSFTLFIPFEEQGGEGGERSEEKVGQHAWRICGPGSSSTPWWCADWNLTTYTRWCRIRRRWKIRPGSTCSIVPEYILSISRSKPGSQQLTPVRVVVFRRDDLLPYQQDLFDSEGNLETEVDYENYRDFNSVKYPSKITIKRPLEEYQLVLTVESVQENTPLTDDQFQIKIPEGTPIQHLE
jgi:outer membrane lipoprotein-sorting protein